MDKKELEQKMLVMGCLSIISLVIVIGIVVVLLVWY